MFLVHPRCEGSGYFFGEKDTAAVMVNRGRTHHTAWRSSDAQAYGYFFGGNHSGTPTWSIGRSPGRVIEVKGKAGAKALGYFSEKEKTRVRIPSGISR